MAEKFYFPDIYLVPALTLIIFENQLTMKFGQNNGPKTIQRAFFNYLRLN